MSEKISLEALLPVAKDLYLSMLADKSLLARLQKAGESRTEAFEKLAEEFTLFVSLLERKLTEKG